MWKLYKDLCAYLLSLEDEDVDSVIFMVFGFHSVGMPYPKVLVFRSQMESKERRRMEIFLMILEETLCVVLPFTYSLNIHFLTAYYFPVPVLCSGGHRGALLYIRAWSIDAQCRVNDYYGIIGAEAQL